MTIEKIHFNFGANASLAFNKKKSTIIRLKTKEEPFSLKQVSSGLINNTKRVAYFVQDLFDKNLKHIFNNSGELAFIKELKFKDKDNLEYLSKAQCEKGKIVSRTLYENGGNQIKKRYTYSLEKQDRIMKEEIFEKGKLYYILSHEYDHARLVHTVTQKDAQNNIQSIKLYNFLNEDLIKEIKP